LSEVRDQNVVDSSPPPGVPRGDESASGAAAMPRLVDVPVRQVLTSPDSALNRARQRVLSERGPGESYAAHGSSPVT
jgi:FXSXX-COOH protein